MQLLIKIFLNNCNSITTLKIKSKSEITFQNNRFHLPKLTSIEIPGNKVIIKNNLKNLKFQVMIL